MNTITAPHAIMPKAIMGVMRTQVITVSIRLVISYLPSTGGEERKRSFPTHILS